MNSMTRRGAVGLTALAAASYKRILGANERIQVGFIGFGLIGGQHVHDFKNQTDVDLAAMCDVYQPRLEQGVAACGQTSGRCSRTKISKPSSYALRTTGTH
jgi:hypothetical protein